MFKRTIAALAILVAMLCLTVRVDAAPRHTKDDTWLIYWYNCGAGDLEGEDHLSTRDIAEMQQVTLPPNVNVLIYAGGEVVWHHPKIAAEGNGIYLYNADGLVKLKDSATENMGDPATLKSFLEYGEENFAADHRIMIFQDHGGQNGICYVAEKDNNGNILSSSYLSYDALKITFAEVYSNAPENMPFELVAFNACLTGSYELANSIADFSRYMIGSEPSSFSIGWDFQSLFSALANDPSMNGAQIGKVICDSAMKRYEEPDLKNYNLKLASAFSVIDLSKMPELREAYEAYFNEAVIRADEDEFNVAFARAAQSLKADKYSDLYTDLGLLAKNTKSIMPDTSTKLLKAIDKAVVYNKHGAYLNARGISTYYQYTSLGVNYNVNSVISTEDEDSDFVKIFKSQDASCQSQKDFYEKLFNVDFSGFGDVNLECENNHFVAKLEPEQLASISSVQSVLIPVTAGDGESGFGSINFGGAILTSTDDFKIDWKKGTITENLRSVEPIFNGQRILMDTLSDKRGHTLYKVPILYNGDYRDLIVRYDKSTKKYKIVGFGEEIENGIVRNMYTDQLKPGDIITPIYYTIVSEDSIAPDDGSIQVSFFPDTVKPVYFKMTFGEPFVYTRDSEITSKNIATGNYIYIFRFIAPNGKDSCSIPCFVRIEYEKVKRYTDGDLNNAE